jgi:Fe-S-cluster-containing hydrogenase component 2
VFRHRWRDFRVRQLLLQRREQVSACVQCSLAPCRLACFFRALYVVL